MSRPIDNHRAGFDAFVSLLVRVNCAITRADNAIPYASISPFTVMLGRGTYITGSAIVRRQLPNEVELTIPQM